MLNAMKEQKAKCHMVLQTAKRLQLETKAENDHRHVNMTEQPLQLGICSTREWAEGDDKETSTMAL